MIQRWAHIKDGVCINVSLWDGDTARWQPPPDVQMVVCPDFAGINWLYDGTDWSPPPPPPEPPPEG